MSIGWPGECSELCTAVHLLGDVGPEGLDEGHMLGPVQEVHGHAVQQAGSARPGGQADVQIVQVLAAARSSGSPLYLPWLRQPCRQHAPHCEPNADLVTDFNRKLDALCTSESFGQHHDQYSIPSPAHSLMPCCL